MPTKYVDEEELLNRKKRGEPLLRDGEALRVPMTMMDERARLSVVDANDEPAGSRPGWCLPDQTALDELQDLHDEHDREISNAWRSPARVEDTIKDRQSIDIDDELDRAYSERDREISNAWRKG